MNLHDPRHEWMQQYADGVASAETTARLEAALHEDAEFRVLFLEYLNLDCALSAVASSIPEPQVEKVVAFPRLMRPWAWAMAACLVAAAILGSVVLLPQASAAAILRHALKAHAAVLDRCYRVEIKREASSEGIGSSPATRESRLWTRGDRFWIETRFGERTVAWGREAGGAVWFSFSPELGVRMDPDEVREQLALACELRSLQIESLLRSVLADFDLRREPGGARSQIIHAQLKAGRTHPLYRAALLEVDAESGVLRRVLMHRVLRGQSKVVTFTLLETSLQGEGAYTLAGHLTPQAKVYDRLTEPGKRGPLLARFFSALPPSDADR